MDSFVSHYGLAAIFMGCLLEGETVAIAGGLLAHRHLLVPWQVVATVAAAVFVSDMGYFLLARRYRSHRRMRGFAERPAFARALRVMGRNPTLLAAAFRFVPGMRIVGPVALGQSGFPPVRFVLIAGCAGILWATFYVTAGHAVGVAVHALLGDLERDHWLIWVPVVLVLAVGAVLLARRIRRVRRGLRPS